MKLYADRLPQALRQLLGDLLVVLWIYLWVRAALWVQDQVQKLGVPGETLQGAGTGIADNLREAGETVGGVPLVGDDLTAPFTRAAEAARSLAEAGREQAATADRVALVLAIVTASLPLLLVLLIWLPARLRWMRRAAVATAVQKQPAGRDLLALRALASRPLSELARLGPDIAGSWRDGDPAAVDALAELELRSLGVRSRGKR